MKKILLLIIIAILIFMGLLVGFAHKSFADTACGGFFEPSCTGHAQQVVDNQQRMEVAVPIPQLHDSLERANISKRLHLLSISSKVSYIYLISYGKVMAFYTVKGKITSGQKRLTPGQQIANSYGNIIDPGNEFNTGSLIVQSPELDGAYGESSPYIFFWTTSGVYVQWNGEYMMADQPLSLSTPPELIQTAK